ncbi:MAG: hypothetical protein PHU34_05205 [Candidatus Methanoperedens sp.]|nr:hypothetical protein [Candidatus Methanoperedens sp.]
MAEEKAVKEATKATLLGLVKPEAKKEKTAVAVKAPSQIQKTEAVKEVSKVNPEAPKAEVKAEAKPEAKAETKPETKKEADPSKEFVDAVMAEMVLKGGSKKRLVKTLAEQYNFDKQKVLFKLRRALITERYAAEHAEGGGAH